MSNHKIIYSSIALACIFLVGCSKKDSVTPAPISVVQDNQNNGNAQPFPSTQQTPPIQGGGASVVQPKTNLFPKIVIPKTPGNIKPLFEQLAAKYGYKVDWKLKGYYNLDPKDLASYNQPIGFVLPVLTGLMTHANKTLKVYWKEGNPGEPFPYPVDVAYFACDKTLVLFEMENPQPQLEIKATVEQLLKRPEYKHCFLPDPLMGMEFNSPTGTSGTVNVNTNQALSNDMANTIQNQNLDFSQPPPFVGAQGGAIPIDMQALMPPGYQWEAPKTTQPVQANGSTNLLK